MMASDSPGPGQNRPPRGGRSRLPANGQRKARAKRIGAARQPPWWTLLFLSADESLKALIARAGSAQLPDATISCREKTEDYDAGDRWHSAMQNSELWLKRNIRNIL